MSEELQQKLRDQLWEVANKLRGNMSASDFMYFTLSFIFYQYLSEKIEAYANNALAGKNSYYSCDDRQSTIGAFCGIYRSSQPLVKWLMQSQRYRRLVYQSPQGGNGLLLI